MKFLLITHNDIDGVGQTVINLNSTLNKLGHESKAILLYKKNISDNNLILIKRSIFKRIFFFAYEFIKKNFNVIFSFGNSTISYNSIENHINAADIIIIYTMHKMISLKMLSNILSKNKIIYLRPLDLELATGGCHANVSWLNGEECNNYVNGCNQCPQLNFLNIFNFSHQIFKMKKKIFDKYKPTILLENNFTKKFYDNSQITKNAINKVIFLPINKNRSNLVNKEDAKNFFKIKKNEKVILFGTFNLDAPHKGGRILEDILKRFILILNRKNKNKEFTQKIKLFTFGRKNTFQLDIPQIQWTHLGEIFDDKKLNFLYRASDVLVSPATGDNGPTILKEALVNDLAVVAFKKGESEDSLFDGVNGYLIPCYDKDLFAISIYKSLFLKELNDKNNIREMIKLRYDSLNEAKNIILKSKEDLKNRI